MYVYTEIFKALFNDQIVLNLVIIKQYMFIKDQYIRFYQVFNVNKGSL